MNGFIRLRLDWQSHDQVLKSLSGGQQPFRDQVRRKLFGIGTEIRRGKLARRRLFVATG